jgi:nucleoside-diphosphate-sugar epimerase
VISSGQVYLVREGANPTFRESDYRGSLVDALIRLVEQPPAKSDAFNFCQREQPTVRELVELIAAAARAPRPEIVDGVTTESPFSSRWMSCLDPSVLDFPHVPLEQYVAATVQHILAGPL